MKRTEVQKNTSMNNNGNGETSTSSSSTSTSMQISKGQALTTDNKIEGRGNESKKIKGESANASMEVGQEEEESSVEESSMENLPPEMVTKILKFVDTRSLLDCRLVNRNWNEISSGILRNRTNFVARFEYNFGLFVWNRIGFIPEKQRNLRGFLACMKNSKNCPFSQFSFLFADEDNPLKFFKEQDFKEFISYFTSPPQTIKFLGLYFDILDDDAVKLFKCLTAKLRNLFLLEVPRLEELALDFEVLGEAPEVKLFNIPKLAKIDRKTVRNAKVVKIPVPVQLPHLKVLRFENEIISYYPGIIKDLLNASVNLKKLCMKIHHTEEFKFLHSLGKLHLLKVAVMALNQFFFPFTESDKNIGPSPKLEILNLSLNVHDPSPSFWSHGGNFLGNLFETSKDTLTGLESDPIGLFPGLQLPTFTKLRKLDLTQSKYSPQPVFPPGIRSRDVFPVVSELDFNIGAWESAFPQEDFIPILPSLKMLSVCECNCTENSISILALMCPNLETLKIHKHNAHRDDAPKLNLLKVGRAIWTHMKNLKSLEIDVDVDLPENNPFALDSCFTGICLEICQRIGDLREANKLLKKWGFQSDVPLSLLNPQTEHASILNMKDLKTLKINPYSEKKLLKQTDFFTKKLTWISEEYAFNLMPHLKPEPEEED